MELFCFIYLITSLIFVSLYIDALRVSQNCFAEFEDFQGSSNTLYEENKDKERNTIKRTTFPIFDFHAEKDGYIQIGHFLICWGESEKGGEFKKNFQFTPYGGLVIGIRKKGGGKSNIKIRELTRQKARFYQANCERPNQYFVWGEGLDIMTSQITVNSFEGKNENLKKIAYEDDKGLLNPEDGGCGGGGCSIM